MVGILCSYSAHSQHLSERLTVHFNQTPLKDALEVLQSQADVQFSYGSTIINLHNTPVTYTVKAEKLSVILDAIIPMKVRYTELGSYVIIQDSKKKGKEKYSYSGRVIDAKSKQPISDVSVVVVEEQNAEITASEGDYKLDFKNDDQVVHIAISKRNYRDTIIAIEGNYTGVIDIELEPMPLDLNDYSRADSLRFVRMMAGRKSLEHMKNVQFFQNKLAQFSFLPMAGTNGQLSGKTRNNISVNLLAGYSHSLRGVELAGFANIERRDVEGIQMAGFANIVGRETHGIQLAGFVNVNKRKIIGVQMAGFTNIAVDTLTGLQLSGFTNIGPYTRGVQMSGFVNTTWAGSRAHQFSGFVNYSKSNTGSQSAGFLNFTLKEHVGVQGAGFLNYAGSSRGSQLAGFANVSIGVTKGLQAAGFLNIAGTLKGVQLGIINITDTVAAGVSLGMFNFSRKGVFEPEFYVSESTLTNFRLKTGSDNFYNVLGVSYYPEGELFAFGYGLGNRFSYPSGLIRGFEVQGNVITANAEFKNDRVDVLSTIHPFLGYKIHEHLGVFLGPTLNIYTSNHFNAATSDYGYDLVPDSFYETTDNGWGTKLSLGFRFGIAF
jgi:hypothetical protein